MSYFMYFLKGLGWTIGFYIILSIFTVLVFNPLLDFLEDKLAVESLASTALAMIIFLYYGIAILAPFIFFYVYIRHWKKDLPIFLLPTYLGVIAGSLIGYIIFLFIEIVRPGGGFAP